MTSSRRIVIFIFFQVRGSHVGTYLPSSGVWHHTQRHLKRGVSNQKIIHHLDFDAPTREHAQQLLDDKVHFCINIFGIWINIYMRPKCHFTYISHYLLTYAYFFKCLTCLIVSLLFCHDCLFALVFVVLLLFYYSAVLHPCKVEQTLYFLWLLPGRAVWSLSDTSIYCSNKFSLK